MLGVRFLIPISDHQQSQGPSSYHQICWWLLILSSLFANYNPLKQPLPRATQFMVLGARILYIPASPWMSENRFNFSEKNQVIFFIDKPGSNAYIPRDFVQPVCGPGVYDIRPLFLLQRR